MVMEEVWGEKMWGREGNMGRECGGPLGANVRERVWVWEMLERVWGRECGEGVSGSKCGESGERSLERRG